jgi:polar amino acid transport system permease protein
MKIQLAPIWDSEYLIEILPDLWSGFQVTLKATAVGIVIALVLGLIIAVLRRSKSPFLSYPAMGFTEFVRSTPLLVQLFFMFYVLPDLEIFPQFHVDVPVLGVFETNPDGGLLLAPFATGAITLGIHYGAYTSEVYRAGIDGVQRGQWEASTALSLSPRDTWTNVILPQAIPTVVPALGNYFIAMFKEVPLLYAITVLEVLAEARIHCNRDFRCLEPYTAVGVIFLSISIPASLLVRYLERRIGYARA